MKITISGHPGGGSTSLALILCRLLNLKYISGGAFFRYLGERLNYSDTGIDRITADKYLEEFVGKLWDSYVDEILLDKSVENILIESDVASFRLGKLEDVISVFLLTDDAVRKQRLGSDGRALDTEILHVRDMENSNIYKNMYGIDWFSRDQIYSFHNAVIDNSHLTITQTVEKVLGDKFNQKLKEECMALEDEFFKSGKKVFLDNLQSKNLLPKVTDTIAIFKVKYADKINLFPEILKNVF